MSSIEKEIAFFSEQSSQIKQLLADIMGYVDLLEEEDTKIELVGVVDEVTTILSTLPDPNDAGAAEKINRLNSLLVELQVFQTKENLMTGLPLSNIRLKYLSRLTNEAITSLKSLPGMLRLDLDGLETSKSIDFNEIRGQLAKEFGLTENELFNQPEEQQLKINLKMQELINAARKPIRVNDLVFISTQLDTLPLHTLLLRNNPSLREIPDLTRPEMKEVYLTGIPFDKFPQLPKNVIQVQIDFSSGIFPQTPPRFLLPGNNSAGLIIQNVPKSNQDKTSTVNTIQNVKQYFDFLRKHRPEKAIDTVLPYKLGRARSETMIDTSEPAPAPQADSHTRRASFSL